MNDKDQLLNLCNGKMKGADFLQAHIYRQIKKIVADHDSIEDIKVEVEALQLVQQFLANQMAHQGQGYDVLETAMFPIVIYSAFLLYLKRFLP